MSLDKQDRREQGVADMTNAMMTLVLRVCAVGVMIAAFLDDMNQVTFNTGLLMAVFAEVVSLRSMSIQLSVSVEPVEEREENDR